MIHIETPGGTAKKDKGENETKVYLTYKGPNKSII